MRKTAHTVEPSTDITYGKTENSATMSRPRKPIEPNRNMSKKYVNAEPDKNATRKRMAHSDIAYGKAEDSGNDVDDEKVNRNKAKSNMSDQWIRNGDRRAGSLG